MTSTEFLEVKLKELFIEFPKGNFRYEYRANRGSHIIEITPLDLYNNDDYKIAEISLEEEFMELYPGEDIVFVSDDSLTKITNPCFELIGEQNLTWCLVLNQEEQYNMDLFGIDMEFAGENNYALAA